MCESFDLCVFPTLRLHSATGSTLPPLIQCAPLCLSLNRPSGLLLIHTKPPALPHTPLKGKATGRPPVDRCHQGTGTHNHTYKHPWGNVYSQAPHTCPCEWLLFTLILSWHKMPIHLLNVTWHVKSPSMRSSILKECGRFSFRVLPISFSFFLFNDHKHTINCHHFPNGAEGMWQCHSFALQVAFHGAPWMPGHVTLECHWAFPHIKTEIPPCWGEVRAFPADRLSSTLSICLPHSLHGGESVSGKGHTVKACFWKEVPMYCAFTSYFWRELEVSVGKDLGFSPP